MQPKNERLTLLLDEVTGLHRMYSQGYVGASSEVEEPRSLIDGISENWGLKRSR